MQLFLGIRIKLVFLLDVFDILGHLAEIRRERAPFLLRLDAPDLDATRFDRCCGEERAGGVPLDDGGLLAVLEDAQQTVGAELPDVDVLFHVGGGGDVVGGLVQGGGGVGEGAVVPAEAVDEVLEFVEGGEGDVFGEGFGGGVFWDGVGGDGGGEEAG